jgi:hypothetical protein
MGKVYVPATGPADWQRLLGDPIKHWRTGYSAKTLAHCWEAAGGLPPEIARMLHVLGADPELLIAIPEHKVPLPGGTRGESQNDLFTLVRIADRTAAIAIEGKVNEPFDRTLDEWLHGASEGKRVRLSFLCDLLGLSQPVDGNIRYQLLHRTASAIIEARRFKTDIAAMIVHSFSPDREWFDEFARFAALFNVSAQPDTLLEAAPDRTPPLYLGWACGDLRFLESI